MKVEVVGELRPPWMVALDQCVEDANRQGWTLTTDIVFSGHPYEFRGEVKLSSWAIGKGI